MKFCMKESLNAYSKLSRFFSPSVSKCPLYEETFRKNRLNIRKFGEITAML